MILENFDNTKTINIRKLKTNINIINDHNVELSLKRINEDKHYTERNYIVNLNYYGEISGKYLKDSIQIFKDFVVVEDINIDNINIDNIDSLLSNTFRNSTISKINIPNSVTTLGSNLFYNCKQLVTVTLSDNITTIPRKCFMNCYSLESIDLGVCTTIENSAFKWCIHLYSVVFPNIEDIGSYAFYGCRSFVNLTLPNNKIYIHDCAYSRCKNLYKIRISKKSTICSYIVDHGVEVEYY